VNDLNTGDRALHHSLYDSIQLLGNSELGQQNGISLLDSPLGNAIMLAMLTAQPHPSQTQTPMPDRALIN